MASYAWGGVANGNIALSLMKLALGVYLRVDAALALLAMAAAFEQRFGVALRVTEGYRPLGSPGDYDAGRSNTQWYYWVRRQRDSSAPSAAPPGGSIHGWGLAVDINLNGMTRDMIEWLHTEGRKYGFNWDTTGRPSGEPWHLDFNLPVTASLDTETKEDDDMCKPVAILEVRTNGRRAERLWGCTPISIVPLDTAREKDVFFRPYGGEPEAIRYEDSEFDDYVRLIHAAQADLK
jgi:hypothetical protein